MNRVLRMGIAGPGFLTDECVALSTIAPKADQKLWRALSKAVWLA